MSSASGRKSHGPPRAHRLPSKDPISHDDGRRARPLSAHPGCQPMAGHALGHAAHLHGGARHRHRLGGAALHCRLALGLQLRGHVGAHQLPGRQRRHPACVELVRAAFWPQALPADLRHPLHHRVVLLRGGAVAGRHSSGARSAGRGRRRVAAALAIHPAGKLSHREALHVHGRLRPRHRGGAGARPHAGRLAHRYLELALRLLHQHSRRHPGGHHDQPLRPRSALHQERQGGRLRQHRLRPAGGVDRLPADRSRQGPGGRLVRRHLGALGRGRAGGRAPCVDLALLGSIPKAWSTCTCSRTATSAPAAS